MPEVWPGAGVHDEAGGLVDDEEVRVLVDHRHRHVGVGHQPGVGGALGDVDVDDVALGEAVGPRRDGLVVHGHRAVVDERRGLGPASAGDEGDHPVEPLAVERPRHDLAHQVGSAGCGGLPSTSASRHCTTNNKIAPTTIAAVGEVEHRPPLQVDEVDHTAAEEPVALAERPVDQVAEGATDHEAERDGHEPAASVAAGGQQHGHHTERQQRDRARPGRWRC